MGHPIIGPDKWNLRARIPRAINVLASADQALPSIVWDRLRRDPNDRLPQMERIELPADIFVDVIRAVGPKNSLTAALRTACAVLLDQQVKASEFKEPLVVVELVYLAARIESEASIPALTKLVSHPGTAVSVREGRSLKFQAVRALVGMLAAYPNAATEEHRHLFSSMLDQYPDIMIAALVGLFGEPRELLVTAARAKGQTIRDESIDQYLRVAGFA